MKKKSVGSGLIRLRVALPVFFTIFLLITGSTIFLVSYYFSQRSLEAVSFEYLGKTGETVVERTVNHLSPAASIAATNATYFNPENFSTDFLSAFNVITIPQFKSYPQLALVYYGDNEGNFWMNGRDPDWSISTQIIERLIDTPESDEKLTQLKNKQKNTDKFDVEEALAPILKTKIIFRGPDGDLLHTEDVKDYIYDPRWRPWYKNADNKRSVSWTGAYRFSSSGRYYASGKTGISVSAPVINSGGELEGVVGVDIFLEELTKFLRGLEISTNGRAFIITPEGELIAFGNLQLASVNDIPEVFTPLDSISDTAAAASYQYLLGEISGGENDKRLSKTVELSYDIDEGKYLAYFSPIPESAGPSWIIGVIAPEDDFIGDLKEKLLLTIVIATGVLILMIIISIIIGNKITLPIKHLMEDAMQIKDLNLNDTPQISSGFTEIADMNEAFLNMKMGLRSFQKYIPGDVVRYLIKSGNEAILGGEERTLTVFFSDVADFTTISEQLQPGDLVSHLGDYLGEYSRIIEASGGTVDKYIGDAVMAFWNAPNPLEDHAIRACAAALECVSNLQKMHKRWFEGKLPLLETRIGIHTGEVIVGNMGSSERLNYTIIGDPVNLGSRLEGLAKVYGVKILVSEVTRDLAMEKFHFRKLDKVIVKGKTIPITVYELLYRKENISPQQKVWIETFESAFDAYCIKEWVKAEKLFRKAFELNPEDKAALLFIKRIMYFKDHPPKDDWAGVSRFTSK